MGINIFEKFKIIIKIITLSYYFKIFYTNLIFIYLCNKI